MHFVPCAAVCSQNSSVGTQPFAGPVRFCSSGYVITQRQDRNATRQPPSHPSRTNSIPCVIPHNKATIPAPAASTPPSPMTGMPVTAGAALSVAEEAAALAELAIEPTAEVALSKAEPASLVALSKRLVRAPAPEVAIDLHSSRISSFLWEAKCLKFV